MMNEKYYVDCESKNETTPLVVSYDSESDNHEQEPGKENSISQMLVDNEKKIAEKPYTPKLSL